MSDVWTGDRVERLKTLWTAGRTCTEIANDLACGVSRNAVIGKVTRLKLPPRGARIADAAPRIRMLKPGKIVSLSQVPTISNRNPTNSLAAKLAIAEAEPGLPEKLHGEKPDGTGIQLGALSDLNCHFPKGDPLEAGFEFCGGKAIPGMPYCAHHCRVAYSAPNARWREPEELRPKLNSARTNNFYQR